jgi:hypothetical protein
MTVDADLVVAEIERIGRAQGVRLDAELDESRQTTALYFATHSEQGGGEGMDIYRP